MKKIIHQLEQYLLETIGVTVTPHPWENNSGLPQYLRERYLLHILPPRKRKFLSINMS